MAPTSLSVSTEAGSYATVAFSAAKFTSAARTPAVLERAFSTRRAHAAHVIPETGRETLRKSSLIPKTFDSPTQITIPPYPIQGLDGSFIWHLSGLPASARSGGLAGPDEPDDCEPAQEGASLPSTKAVAGCCPYL